MELQFNQQIQVESRKETEDLGEALAKKLLPHTVIGLFGDLGAGKTCFVRGLGRGVGVQSMVHSPTFALLNLYEGGKLPLVHIDLYRLDTADQVLEAGFEPYLFRPEGVTAVEWMERMSDFLPQKHVHYYRVYFAYKGETARSVYIESKQ